jgi:hypothetical protein
MIPASTPSATDGLSLEETITRLKASPFVDGIAEFGSRAASLGDASSDYDLLVLVSGLPVRVFQLVTSIDGRLADIVLVETETADALLTADDLPEPRSFEALFARKMQTARILYDATQRLHRVQQRVTGPAWAEMHLPGGSSRPELHAIWFWQSFGLLQLERMSRSQDPLHLTAFDMMMASCLPGTWRGYFDLRGAAWEGEKAALRYWAAYDAGYLETVKRCLETEDRIERAAAYRALVEQTLAPIGRPLALGETALILASATASGTDVEDVLRYWNALVTA